jgi:hypothetical protein
VKPEKLEQAALRWHGRLELEASMMTLAESQLVKRSRKVGQFAQLKSAPAA